jgi:hypothetical protein
MKSSTLTCIFGLTLLIPASLGLLLTGIPSLLCPLPALTVIPAFLLSSWRLSRAAVIVPVLFFLAWNTGALRGNARIPKRTYALLALATVLSVAWFVSGWNYGLKYQGPRYTHIVCIVNAAWIALLWLIFGRYWKREPSFKINLLLHWILFAWLAWYAFPYLGELP